MENSGRYTYEDSVECSTCSGSSLVTCRPCRGAGHCRHCDKGFVQCGSCYGHGFHECIHCHGDGFVIICERVWDPCKRCYVERHVHVRCDYCHGHGRISCSCRRGLVPCRDCEGVFTCRTCRGSRQVKCTACRNGIVIHIRKTAEGEEIDRDIEGAERVFHALNSRIAALESLIRQERKLRTELERFLKVK